MSKSLEPTPSLNELSAKAEQIYEQFRELFVHIECLEFDHLAVETSDLYDYLGILSDELKGMAIGKPNCLVINGERVGTVYMGVPGDLDIENICIESSSLNVSQARELANWLNSAIAFHEGKNT